MTVTFDQTYLQELYTDGQANDKHLATSLR